MLKIRLRRTGAKKQASYRVVVAESSSPRDGKFIEILGHYNPRTDPPTLVIKDEERLFYWLSVGAQPTDSMKRILVSKGILEKKTQAEAEVPAEEVASAEVEEIEETPEAEESEEA
ncbi:MAG TPA: 30S ribosomal protein S16 [Chloroflexi bacterium]|nr:MAG: 30S ribosomal protein S16 [Anaerolineaceae bacterium 4572_5.1]HEY84476.1 30S ribosomal protein S16 [Chloroflexota bacterium]